MESGSKSGPYDAVPKAMGPRLYGLSAFGSTDPENRTTVGLFYERDRDCCFHSHLLIRPSTATPFFFSSRALSMSSTDDSHGSAISVGFRMSGVSTPQISEHFSDGLPMSQLSNLVPDPNGLGWPGIFASLIQYKSFFIFFSAKSTVSRLNASPQEKVAREQKMASAIRTILECIGEDPDREGLRRTPERYAQAVMWMTRGYEERLAG
jgi:hypothetical protein